MTETAQKWIEAGYAMFAEIGPKDFKIEKLANHLGLNKSGFYHYFSDREGFFSELMEYHDLNGRKFVQEISLIKEFMPDYVNLLIKYKTGVSVQMQLRKNANIPMFKECFYRVQKRNNIYQIPLWAGYLNLTDHQLATELQEIAMEVLMTRMESQKLTFDFLSGVFEGIKHTLDKLRLKK
jgi:AcrR family transcriptional regulator